MEDWLAGLIGLAGNKISDIVAAIQARLSSIWSTSTGFWTRIRTGLGSLRAAGAGWINSHLGWLVSLATTLQWVILVYVPRKAFQFASDVKTWATDEIQSAKNLASSALTAARTFLLGLINAVIAGVNNLTTWALGAVSALNSNVGKLLDRVFGVLATPERLVAWILGALVSALVDWAKQHAISLGRAIIATRAQIILDSLGLLEDLVNRII